MNEENLLAAPASVQAVAVAFAVLEELANSGAPVGTSELARRLHQTKARVHRHLVTLRELGFVEKDSGSDRYRLGWKAYRLGITVTESFDLREIAQPHLRRLHEESGQTVALAIPAGATDITVIETLTRADQLAITIRPGSVIPATSSALGRVILAFQSADRRAAALREPIRTLTDETARDAVSVERLIEAARAHWYALAVNERLPGVAALAAPVFDDRGHAVAAICVIGSQAVVTDPPSAVLVAQVQQAAARISRALRSSAWDSAPASAAGTA